MSNSDSLVDKAIIRIAVLEDSDQDFATLKERLRLALDIEIVYRAYDSKGFIDYVMEHLDIDIALIDILLGEDQIDGIEVIRQLKTPMGNDRELPCLAFTKVYDLNYLINAIEAGATGFLRKEPPTRMDPSTGIRSIDNNYVIDYAQAIRTVTAGQTCFDRRLITELAKQFRTYLPNTVPDLAQSKHIEFTRRQLEIMSIRVKYPEFTNSQVAYVLKIIEQTVRGHTANINRLLNVHSYKEATELWKSRRLKTLPLRPDYETRCIEISGH